MKTDGAATTEHRKVQELVRRLIRQGYRVQTEVQGLHIRPDIVATKDGKTLVIEVKTQDSLSRHVDRVKELAAYFEQHEGTTFRLVVVKTRKKASIGKSRKAVLANSR